MPDVEHRPIKVRPNPFYLFSGWHGACPSSCRTRALIVLRGHESTPAVLGATNGYALADGPYADVGGARALRRRRSRQATGCGPDTVKHPCAPPCP